MVTGRQNENVFLGNSQADDDVERIHSALPYCPVSFRKEEGVNW